jgi:peptide methionine sulfoxide reductase MsrA
MYKNPVVTEVVELKDFYRAEDYHLDYYDNNQKEGYCRAVITPKVEKIVK